MLAALPGDATGFLILFARLGAMLMLLPVFGEDAVPGRLRLLIALGMTAGLWSLLRPSLPPTPPADVALAGLLVTELGIGLALGALVKLMFQSVVMAGALISLQVGLSSALVFDPSLGGQTPLLAKLIALGALLFAMGLGLHHLWIATLVRSYTLFPVGSAPPLGDFAQLALATATRAMTLGVGLAAPFLVYGIVFNVALGFSARLAPAIQVFFIAQPLNLLLGLALLAGTIGTIMTCFSYAFADWLRAGFG